MALEVEFDWGSYPNGAVVADLRAYTAEAESREVLVDRLTREGTPSTATATRPLKDHSGLFLLFAGLGDAKSLRDAIAGFATKYGPLGVRQATVWSDSWPSSPILAEPVDKWEAAIVRMRHATQLWEALRLGRVAAVARALQSPNRAPGILATGWAELERVTRNELSMPTGDATQAAAGWVDLLRADGGHGMRVAIRASSLIGALWLQFALAVDGNRKYKQCAYCVNWFELNPSTNRTSKIYCDDACKMGAYRQRKRGLANAR